MRIAEIHGTPSGRCFARAPWIDSLQALWSVVRQARSCISVRRMIQPQHLDLAQVAKQMLIGVRTLPHERRPHAISTAPLNEDIGINPADVSDPA